MTQKNHYYPFGLNIVSLEKMGEPDMKFQYNGKEKQSEFGLNWADYGARFYDPQIGRWHAVDPLAEKNHFDSPCAYTHNNPLIMIDPDGKDGIRVVDAKNKTITIKAVYYVQTENRAYVEGTNRVKFIQGYSEKDIQSLQEKTNEYLNGLEATLTEGDYKGYKVQFDLQFKAGGDIVDAEKKASEEKIDGYSVGNSFAKGNEKTTKAFQPIEIKQGDGVTTSISVAGGQTAEKKNITMNVEYDTKMNRIHEIFHTLGFSDSKDRGKGSGIMKYPPEKPTQADINQLGNDSFLPTVIKKDEE
ncbi:MAG: RHS repeat-associated core domain-containing protein [Microscillaceae bacterium]|nr:RHS repeat-associated core domain-containing protein [Microscillaceae bacterium]